MKVSDALLNAGLPHLADQYRNNNELTKEQTKEIINQIEKFDNYYKKGWKGCETRETLKQLVNNYIIVCRWYSIQLVK